MANFNHCVLAGKVRRHGNVYYEVTDETCFVLAIEEPGEKYAEALCIWPGEHCLEDRSSVLVYAKYMGDNEFRVETLEVL